MRHDHRLRGNRLGITVLALLLIIIAIVVLAFFLFQYLRPGTSA